MNADQAGMKRRKYERIRATAKVTYRVLDLLEKEIVLKVTNYRPGAMVQFSPLPKTNDNYHAVMNDISEGGLSITGEHKLTVGDWMEITIMPPKYDITVIMLAEVKWTKTDYQSGKEVNTAGVLTLALDPVSMDQLSRFLMTERILAKFEI